VIEVKATRDEHVLSMLEQLAENQAKIVEAIEKLQKRVKRLEAKVYK
jgi:hypothetical protein